MVEICLKAEPLMFAGRVGIDVRMSCDGSWPSKWKDRVSPAETGRRQAGWPGCGESPTCTG